MKWPLIVFACSSCSKMFRTYLSRTARKLFSILLISPLYFGLVISSPIHIQFIFTQKNVKRQRDIQSDPDEATRSSRSFRSTSRSGLSSAAGQHRAPASPRRYTSSSPPSGSQSRNQTASRPRIPLIIDLKKCVKTELHESSVIHHEHMYYISPY